LAMTFDHFPSASSFPGDLSAMRLLIWLISKSLCLLSEREHFDFSNLKILRGHLLAVPSTMLRSKLSIVPRSRTEMAAFSWLPRATVVRYVTLRYPAHSSNVTNCFDKPLRYHYP
jgi:hypothetical protein